MWNPPQVRFCQFFTYFCACPHFRDNNISCKVCCHLVFNIGASLKKTQVQVMELLSREPWSPREVDSGTVFRLKFTMITEILSHFADYIHIYCDSISLNVERVTFLCSGAPCVFSNYLNPVKITQHCFQESHAIPLYMLK